MLNLRILIVCVARHLRNVAPELFSALQEAAYHLLVDVEGHAADTIDFIILTEQPKRGGKKLTGNQARGFNMNKIRSYALEKKYDYLFKVDGDMIPPKNGLARLLKTSKTLKAPIVTSLTPERPDKCGTDEFSQSMSWNGNRDARNKIRKLKPFICTGNAGEAFMLMTRSALEKIVWPSYRSAGDYAFWREVRKQGITPYCDPMVICAHKEQKGANRGQLVRGTEWVVKHWTKRICENLRRGKLWYHGFPYAWWYGETPELFLQRLPKHIQTGNEPRWSLYKGKKQ